MLKLNTIKNFYVNYDKKYVHIYNKKYCHNLIKYNVKLYVSCIMYHFNVWSILQYIFYIVSVIYLSELYFGQKFNYNTNIFVIFMLPMKSNYAASNPCYHNIIIFLLFTANITHFCFPIVYLI